MRWITWAAVAFVAASMVVAACDREGWGAPASAGTEPTAAEPAATEPAAEQAAATPTPTKAPDGQAPTSFESSPPPGTRAHCPVMGRDFTVTAESLRSEHEGRTYVFCCPPCKARFDADPAQFIGGASRS